MQQDWTPALRMVAGTLGGALIWHGVRSHGPMKATFPRCLADAGCVQRRIL
jgi:hypothetical protein